mmetsp:Transcript_16430/g.31131  ORF Transcript_16430/g.31131 Transcript_16430/m.31131 type:complete len:95 (+) Transcript_16430:22-306(+)
MTLLRRSSPRKKQNSNTVSDSSRLATYRPNMKTSTQKNHAAQGDKGVDRNEVSAIGTKVPGVTSECMKCSYKKCSGNDSIDPASCVMYASREPS